MDMLLMLLNGENLGRVINGGNKRKMEYFPNALLNLGGFAHFISWSQFFSPCSLVQRTMHDREQKSKQDKN